jgi:hypothetical protein
MKVARAGEHFDALRAKVMELDHAHPFRVHVTPEPDTGEYVMKIGQPPELPHEWAGIVGDIGHNLRSALDYLVYELAVKGGGNPERERTAFPISDDRDDYWKPRGRRKISYRDQCLAGVDERWRRKIDDIQPYHRRNNAADTHLSRLNWLSNRDKHRTPHPAYSMLHTPGQIFTTANGETIRNVEIRFSPTGRDFSVEASLNVDANFDPTPTGTVLLRAYEKSKMDREVGFTIGFGERRITLEELQAMIRHVRAILDWFKPAFDPATTTD